MVEEIRDVFQTLLIPQLEGIKGELKAINIRIDSLDSKIESFRRELAAEIRRYLRRELLAEIKAAR